MKQMSETIQERKVITEPDLAPLLNTEEAAKLLRIHPKTLQRMARKGEIPAIQIGKLWRFAASALLLWQDQKIAG